MSSMWYPLTGRPRTIYAINVNCREAKRDLCHRCGFRSVDCSLSMLPLRNSLADRVYMIYVIIVVPAGRAYMIYTTFQIIPRREGLHDLCHHYQKFLAGSMRGQQPMPA